jgi:hypothetical protein
MTLDDQLRRAVDTLGDKLRDDIARELHVITDEWASRTVRNLAPPPPPPQPPDSGVADRLVAAVRTIDQARTLSEVLDTLATEVGGDASRAAVFVVRDGRVRSWRLVGFPARFDGERIDLSLDEAGVVAEAVSSGALASSAASLFDQLESGVEAIAAPIVLAGEPVAVLYAEGGERASVEVLARFAARALEALTALRAARAVAGNGVGAKAPDAV